MTSSRPNRPYWYPALATLWFLMVLPGYIGGLLYRGTLNPLPDLPQPGDGAIGVVIWVGLILAICVPPFFLVRAECRYWRERREFGSANAQD